MKLFVGDKLILIDKEDYPLIAGYTWFVGQYAYAQVKRRTVYMHRLIADTPNGMETDHINHNKLDNRRANLRVCTRSANSSNRRSYGASRVKYVYKDKTKGWPYTVQKLNKTLGRFKNLHDAETFALVLREEA